MAGCMKKGAGFDRTRDQIPVIKHVRILCGGMLSLESTVQTCRYHGGTLYTAHAHTDRGYVGNKCQIMCKATELVFSKDALSCSYSL